MPGFATLSRRLARRKSNYQKAVDKLVRKVAIVSYQSIVFRTPVDTGKARSNWHLTLDSPRFSVRQPFAPGIKLGINETANAQAAINQALSLLSTRRNGQDIYIVNNVKYIQKLNNGSSPQAPASFVQFGIQDGVQTVRNIKVLNAD